MKKNNDEIISRRNFFKKAAGTIVPAIAVTILPNVLTSCEIDVPEIELPTNSGGCSTCKGSCGGGCTSNCGVACGSGCKGRCGGACSSSCGSSCYALCTNSLKY